MTPARIIIVTTIFITVSFSFNNIVPSNRANTTEVSRNADTTAMGADRHAIRVAIIDECADRGAELRTIRGADEHDRHGERLAAAAAAACLEV